MKIVIPAYGRHELTRRVALYYDDLGVDASAHDHPGFLVASRSTSFHAGSDHLFDRHRNNV